MGKKISLSSIVASCAGGLFETYDMLIYVSVIVSISRIFLSNLSPSAAHLISLLIFALGFISRPIGAAIFGHIGDKWGRKKAFLSTIVIMGISTLLMGLLPGYQQIGLAAPVLLMVLRILQGLSFGGEFAGSCVFVYEHAPKQQRGLYVSLAMFFTMMGLLLGYAMAQMMHLLAGDQFDSWGWRALFLMGLPFLLISLWLRLGMKESPIFCELQEKKQVEKAPLISLFKKKKNVLKILSALFGFQGAGSLTNCLGFIFPLIFLTTSTHLNKEVAGQLVLIATAIGIPFALLAGWLADKVGPKIVLIISIAVGLVVYFPAYAALLKLGNADHPSTMPLLSILMLLSVIASMGSGAYVALLARHFPVALRYSASNLTFGLSTIIFYGLLPMIVAAINQVAHSDLVGLSYPIVFLVVSLVVIYFSRWDLSGD